MCSLLRRTARSAFTAARALGLLAAACRSAPTPPASAAPASAERPSALTAEAIGRRLLALTPSQARAAGLHEYDAQIADYSRAGIEAQIAMLRELQSEVAALRPRASSEDERLDLAVLDQMLALALFDLVEVESWRTRPAFYSELFSVEEYIVRDYAPQATRARALRDHLMRARTQLPHIEENLGSPLSEPVVRTAIDIFRGFGVYLRGDVQAFLAGVEDPALRAEARELAHALARAADRLAERLSAVELQRADQSHVLGRERFERLLVAQEALHTPIEELEALAQADLARNEAAYAALAAQVSRSRPPASELLGEARQVVEAARAFMVGHGLVSLPLEPHVQVRESPPFMRWNSAFLSAGGPFDAADLPAYYYVTLPDPAWPAREQAEYVMTRGELVSTGVHEVFPGHYLQALWQRSAPTFVQKVASSYSFVEGWAHYAEQMMIEAGFARDQPEALLGQLSDALLRNCRFVAAIGLHVRGMSVADAQHLFSERCKQDAANARQQAIRGTFDPGYFAYTLGKLQILALRRDAEQRLGARFDLRRFHDALLAHGAPPVPLLRERVLAELGVGAVPGSGAAQRR